MNYRHFEDDEAQFAYKESGFDRLNKIVDCANGLFWIFMRFKDSRIRIGIRTTMSGTAFSGTTARQYVEELVTQLEQVVGAPGIVHGYNIATLSQSNLTVYSGG